MGPRTDEEGIARAGRVRASEARGVARGWWNGSEVVEARDWVTDEGDAFFDWDSDRTRRSVA